MPRRCRGPPTFADRSTSCRARSPGSPSSRAARCRSRSTSATCAAEGYYTGIRFAAYASGAPNAILRGGRYDELIGRYGRPLRATGFAIDLEMVAEALHGAPDPIAARGVALATPGAAAIARALRARGLRAVVQPDATHAWLAGAGLDVLIHGDRLIVDGDEHFAADAIESARAGDTEPLRRN